MSGGHGGRRAGAGRRPGGQNKHTVEIRTVAMQYGPAAVAALAEMSGLAPGERAESETARIAALKELLDRAYGRSTQPLSGDPDGPPLSVEFTWADAVPQPKPDPELEVEDAAGFVVAFAETCNDC